MGCAWSEVRSKSSAKVAEELAADQTSRARTQSPLTSVDAELAMVEPQLSWSTPRECARLFTHGVTVRTAGPVALVVGTILSAVNQGSTIAEGAATWVTWIRVGVNYCVPFIVASIGFLSACRTARLDERRGT